MNNERWLLPEGIEELLSPQAARLEQLRRRMLDLYQRWGYELVIPPLVEFLDSLLTGAGNDLDTQTFKLTDQLSGRLMGVRADITPQVARIDAHRMQEREGPVRLCYAGTVLHTRADGLGGARSFTQIGAELYGHAGVESDAEMLVLMIESLELAGIDQLYVDLGHVGIFRALIQAANLTADQEATLFDALQRKAVPEIEALLAELDIDPKSRQSLVDLVWLNGDQSILGEAKKCLAGNQQALQALDEISAVAKQLGRYRSDVSLHFDLAELRGFNYHTGVVYAAYLPGQGRAIAQGGRYDNIGKVFGRARAATGFSADLRSLAVLGASKENMRAGIFAPASDDIALQKKIQSLRAAGEKVVSGFTDQTTSVADSGCDRILVNQAGTWSVQQIDSQ